MSEEKGLPEGWQCSSLDLFAEVGPRRGKPNALATDLMAFVPMTVVEENFGGIDVSRTRPFGEVEKGYTQFKSGDILFAKITPCMENGKLAIVPLLGSEYGYGSTEFHVIRPWDSVTGRWIAYYLSQESVRRDARSNMTGTAGQLRVPDRWLRALCIPIAPLNEQRRILAKLDELFPLLDAGVAALKRVRANLKRYRASVLKAAVEGKLTEEWRAAHPATESGADLLQRILRERCAAWKKGELGRYAKAGKTPPKGWQAKYREPAAPDPGGLAPLPVGWAWATVAQVSPMVRYGTSAKTMDDSSGVPVIRMGNIQQGSLDLARLKYLPHSHAEFPELLLKTGDLLFNRTNSSELVGKSAVFKGQLQPCSYASYLIAVRLNSSCAPEYVASTINSVFGRTWVASVVSQQVGQANVNGSKLEAFCFPLPSQDEQIEIVAEVERRLSVASAAEAQVEAALIRAERLRQSILKRAFEGRLVEQDASDEPASALVARIRAGREAGFAAADDTRSAPKGGSTGRSASRTHQGPGQLSLALVETHHAPRSDE